MSTATKRPCACESPDCPKCRAWRMDPAYRALYGGGGPRSVHQAPVLADCPGCPGHVRLKVSPDLPVESFQKLIDAEKHDWPAAGWWTWPHLQEAYRREARAVADGGAGTHVCTGEGQGVVIPGGGKFFPSVYVTVRALRHVGCTLPVQVWYLGRDNEMPPAWRDLLAPYAVECVDADRVRVEHPFRTLGGWELKPYALAHCPWREVLLLDADCYPCRNPEFLFADPAYLRQGAAFWADSWDDNRFLWEAWGLPRGSVPHVEAGQLLIDKGACGRELGLCLWLNEHSDYYYRIGYGDKATFQGAWALCGRPWASYAARGRWDTHSFRHVGPDGEELFIHRCRDKFRFHNSDSWMSPQNFPENHRLPGLPLEEEVFAWKAELGRLLAPRPSANPRPDAIEIVGDPARLHWSDSAVVGPSPSRGLFVNTLSGHVHVGPEVLFGWGVSLEAGWHDMTQRGPARHVYPTEGRDIRIGRGAWLASGVSVFGPAVIGDHAVIGAGSVVLGDVPAGEFWAGVPARRIRDIAFAKEEPC